MWVLMWQSNCKQSSCSSPCRDNRGGGGPSGTATVGEEEERSQRRRGTPMSDCTEVGRKGRRGTGQVPGSWVEKALWDAGRRQRPATPSLLLSQPLFALPDSRLGSSPADCSPSSWETHPLVWSNVLAADHHPSKCQEAVTQVADLGREHRTQSSLSPSPPALIPRPWGV